MEHVRGKLTSARFVDVCICVCRLQTGLAAALTDEDYTLAARIRDRLKQVQAVYTHTHTHTHELKQARRWQYVYRCGVCVCVCVCVCQVMGTSASRIDWAALGLPDWLCDRAERLGFKYPSGRCQLHTLHEQHSMTARCTECAWVSCAWMAPGHSVYAGTHTTI